MHVTWPRFWTVVVVVVCGVIRGVSAVSAQTKPLDGVTVTGVVADPFDGVIPDAQVELTTDTDTTPISKTTTDQTGTFHLEHVQPGSYTLHITFEGFEPSATPLHVGTRAAGPIRVKLALAGVTQEVTVSNGGLQADTTASNNLNAIVVDDSTLADLPVFDQDIIGTMSRFLDAASIGTNGVTLVVNGMEANGLGVSPSAVQQIKINQDPYSAEYSRPGRGRIEVITKSGADAFHGTGNVIFRDNALNAREPFATTKPHEQRRIFEGYLGGPIGDGKHSSFTLSIDHDEEDQDSFIYAVGPNGPITGNVATPFRNTEAGGSVSHQKSEQTTMTFRVWHEDQRRDNRGVGGLTLAEAGANNHNQETEFIYTQNTILTSRLLHLTRVMYGQEHETTDSLSTAPRIVVLDSFTGGGAQADLLRTEHHGTLTDTLTWTPGKHTIKGGINIPDWSRRRYDDNTNFGGTFYFASLDDYRAQKPYVFTQQQGNGHVAFLEKVVGLFVQDEITVDKSLTLAIGLRYDWQNYFHDNNNFAPRGSFAWAPTALGRSVIRGGAGFFHDRTGPGIISDLLHSQGGKLLRYNIIDPGYPNPLGAGQSLSAQPASVVQLSPDVQIPATLQFSVGIERPLTKKSTISATYIGLRGYNQFFSRDINAPLPPLYAARPDPSHGVVREVESSGHFQSDSLQLTMRGGVTKYFSGQLQYTLARAYNNTSGIWWYPANDYDLSGEWARADFDQRHHFEALGTLKFGDFTRVGMAVSLGSGRPYSLLLGEDLYNNGRGSARPAGVSRNSLEGPGYADVDLRWARDVFVRKGSKPGDDETRLTVGVDAFNILNRTNFNNYVGTLDSPLFGQPVSAQPPRRIQVSLRARF